MKKCLALLLAAALLLGTVACFAETAAANVISWSDFEDKTAEYTGSFVKLADSGLMIYLAEGWVDLPVSEESQATGTFVTLQTAQDMSSPLFTMVSAQRLPVPVTAFRAKMEETAPGCTEEVTLNGTDVITYSVESDGGKAMGVAFPAADGAQTITISFAPVTDDNTALVSLMLASLQPAQE